MRKNIGVTTLSYGLVFRIDFSCTDHIRHNSARSCSFSKFSIFRKFVFVFVSGFTTFTLILVFKCKSRKRLKGFPTVFIIVGDSNRGTGALW
jgi:hypothetical protein